MKDISKPIFSKLLSNPSLFLYWRIASADRRFIQWAERYLSEGKADGQRPYINWILRDFRDCLIDKKLKPKDKEKIKKYNYNRTNNYRLSRDYT